MTQWVWSANLATQHHGSELMKQRFEAMHMMFFELIMTKTTGCSRWHRYQKNKKSIKKN